VNIGAVLVGIALLVLVVAYVARPLFERQAERHSGHAGSNGRQAQLIDRRDAIYAVIRELDTDFQTGKITEEDYQAQRQRYVTEGVSLLKQLDALSSEDAVKEIKISGPATLEDEIEAAVLELRQKPGIGEPAEKTSISEPATRFCTQCGHPAAPEDNFCGECGTPLKRTALQ
jgi:hypothetical protein